VKRYYAGVNLIFTGEYLFYKKGYGSYVTEILQLTYTLDNIAGAARQFWDRLHDYRLFAFNGEMGAGKTTFIHYLCDYLQVEDTVSSPTFALINEYHFDADGKDNIIYHMDWYRLRDMAEAMNAGMDDCMEQGRRGDAYCFIEWPERAGDLLTKPYINIEIELLSPTERRLTATLYN